MSKRLMVCIVALIVWFVSIGAERREPHQEEIDFAGQGFVKMHTTAYHQGEITANGSKVHTGGCACNPHLGDIAIVYTLDGQFLGYYECNDTGSTSGLTNGTVIDVYRNNYTQCEMYMKLTGGKVWVKWIEGNG